MRLSHLARRAVQVASGKGITPQGADLAVSVLLPHELRLFAAAPPVDQAHGVAVARAVAERVGPDPRWMRAALVHDAGKGRAGLGLLGRGVVTAVAVAAPVTAARLEERAISAEAGNRLLDPVRRSVRPGAYLAHGPLAAAWLERNGSEEEVTAWVRVHHRPELWPETPLPDDVLRALAECDE